MVYKSHQKMVPSILTETQQRSKTQHQKIPIKSKTKHQNILLKTKHQKILLKTKQNVKKSY